jgi:hypothetical protein
MSRKEVRKAPKDAWRTFSNSVNDLLMSARLHRALSRDHTIKMGSSMAPLGRCTQSEGETLALVAQLLNPVVTKVVAAPANGPNVWIGG